MSKESLSEIKKMDWGNLKPSQLVVVDFLIKRVQELEKLQSESKMNLWARVGNLRAINETLSAHWNDAQKEILVLKNKLAESK